MAAISVHLLPPSSLTSRTSAAISESLHFLRVVFGHLRFAAPAPSTAGETAAAAGEAAAARAAVEAGEAAAPAAAAAGAAAAAAAVRCADDREALGTLAHKLYQSCMVLPRYRT